MRITRYASHTPATASIPPTAHQYAFHPACPPSVVAALIPLPRKNAAAAIISSPITCLSSSLPGPVRGSLCVNCGKAESTRYGAAMPSPTQAKMPSVIAGETCVAHATAKPMNGPAHGVARIAVITPYNSDPGTVSCVGLMLYTHRGRLIGNTPSMPTPITAMNTPTPMVNPAFWNS